MNLFWLNVYWLTGALAISFLISLVIGMEAFEAVAVTALAMSAGNAADLSNKKGDR